MIVSILNQKGGVGKTTTAVTIADLAARHGYKTLLVDLDAQGNCSDSLGIEKGPDLFNVLVASQPVDKTAVHARQNLELIRSDKSTLQAENIVQGANWKEYVLANALENHPYDLVILDCAPSAHVLHIAAMVCSDYLIIPTQLSQFSAAGVIEVESSLKFARRMTATNCEILSILPTMLNRSIDESHSQLDNLVDQYGGLVWSPIPTDAKIIRANRHGQTLTEYAPKTPALTGIKVGQARIGGYNHVFNDLQFKIL